MLHQFLIATYRITNIHFKIVHGISAQFDIKLWEICF